MKKTISKIIIGLIALLAVFAVGCGYNNYITKKVMEKVEVQLAGREAQEFGAYYPVAAGTYYLAGSGIGTTDTSITLRSFTDPFSGEEYTMSDFGDIGYATIDPGTSKKEFISFTGISQDPNSSEATLTGVSRGLQGKYPYTASSTLAKSHSGGAKLIISNPPQHYEKYANRERNQTISGVWTFSSSSPPRYNTDSYSFITGLSYLVNKAYVDNVATSGAADASTNTKGLVEQATLSELMSSASSGDTTAPLFVPNQYFSTSSSATTSVVVTKSNGKINQNFWDLTEDFTWSGEHTFSATATFSGDIDITGSQQGDILYYDGSKWVQLNATTSGYCLKTQGTTSPPVWEKCFPDFAAGDWLEASADTVGGPADIPNWTKKKEIKIPHGGTLRIKFDLHGTSGGEYCVRGKIYRNGVAVGTEREQCADSWQTFSEDISGWSAGDLAQLYIQTDGNYTGLEWRNFRIYVDIPSTSYVNQDD